MTPAPAPDHRDVQHAQPPACFDITAQDAAKSRTFYGELFGWEINVEESMNYGIVEATPERLPGVFHDPDGNRVGLWQH